MSRTTLDIDTPVLRELKRLQREQSKPLGRLVSDLLAQALARRETATAPAFRWVSRPMGEARVSLRDKGAVWTLLDRPDR